MIFGIGIDLVEISRIQKLLEHDAERFTSRYFTKNERDYAEKERLPKVHAQYYATRFAAKEAVVKALGSGFTAEIPAGAIEVTRDTLNKPSVLFHGTASEHLKQLLRAHNKKSYTAHLSLSHERDYAIAYAVLTLE